MFLVEKAAYQTLHSRLLLISDNQSIPIQLTHAARPASAWFSLMYYGLNSISK